MKETLLDIMETDFKESTKDDSRTSRETHHIVRKVALCNTSDNARTHACEKYVHLATGNVTFEREVCRVHFRGQFWSGKQLEEKTSERRRFTRRVVTPSSSSSRKCADSAHPLSSRSFYVLFYVVVFLFVEEEAKSSSLEVFSVVVVVQR